NIGGQSKLLRNLIKLRFGNLVPQVKDKIANATEAELERFAENILKANSAQEVVEIEPTSSLRD
ncbi:MAG: hypothetical protein U9R29_01795, partial [Thermodesulfobacteriota bacterium]|nr:hypothetical protein [Thermodesulfobacteriota bacterium]